MLDYSQFGGTLVTPDHVRANLFGAADEPTWNFGRIHRHGATDHLKRMLAEANRPVSFYDAAPHLKGIGEDKTVVLNHFAKSPRVLNGFLKSQYQPRGTCVSRGAKRIVDLCQVMAIYFGAAFAFDYASHAYIYGSCFPSGTPVTMGDGTEKAIEDVKVGDEVISHTGQKRKVLELKRRSYTGPLYAAQVAGHPSVLRMTAEHPVAVFPNSRSSGHGYTPGKLKWVEAKDLNQKDRVLVPFGNRQGREQRLDLKDWLPGQNDRHDSSIIETDRVRCKKAHSWCNRFIDVGSEFGRLVGLYLAEGSIRVENRVRPEGDSRVEGITFTFGGDEQHFADETICLMRSVFGAESRAIVKPKGKNVIIVRCDNKTVGLFFRSFCGGKAYTKSVPPIFFDAPFRARMALLRGWLDGDGHVRVKRKQGVSREYVEFSVTGTTVSNRLSRDMFRIALSCGIRSTIGRTHRQKAGDTVVLCAEAGLAVYPERRQEVESCGPRIQGARHGRNNMGFLCPVKQIDSIEVVGLPVYNLEVEEDHSYITEGIAVHNCRQYGNDLSYEDGAVGAWAAWTVGHDGSLRNKDVEDDDNLDDLAVKWGARGVPEDVKVKGRLHLVKKVMPLHSVEEVRDWICSGIGGVTVASNVGYEGERDSRGVVRRRGRWSHQMSFTGWRHDIKAGLQDQSWGPNQPGGSIGDIEIPTYSFWTLQDDMAAQIAENDTFGFAYVDAWESTDVTNRP
jgi:hypothetical protein